MADDNKNASQLLVFTIDAKNGQIVKFESVDEAGVHHLVSEEEWHKLVKQGKETGIERLLEDAFEAGIACGVGDESASEEELDSEQEAELRRMLLKPLFEHSAAAHLARRTVLRQAVLQSLIQLAGKSGGPEPDARSAQRH
jgi:hypothetical protein